MHTVAALAFVLAGVLLALGSLLSVGEAQSWDVANAFAADATRPVRRAGMLMGVLGLATLVAATPALVARLSGTPGSTWATAGWVGFAAGAVLFAMALGLAAIAMPALGELAGTGAVSPQTVADRLIEQSPLMVSFLGGNVLYLAWAAIGVGVARSGVFPSWAGWMVTAAAVAAWLGFLHVPVFERFGAAVWSGALAVLGVLML